MTDENANEATTDTTTPTTPTMTAARAEGEAAALLNAARERAVMKAIRSELALAAAIAVGLEPGAVTDSGARNVPRLAMAGDAKYLADDRAVLGELVAQLEALALASGSRHVRRAGLFLRPLLGSA